MQYVGRLHRSRPGKTEARIYDYVDAAVPGPGADVPKVAAGLQGDRIPQGGELGHKHFDGRDGDAVGRWRLMGRPSVRGGD